MRAASTACTESGTWKSDGSSPTDQPPFSRPSTRMSISVATSSSTKNGLPSARSTTTSRREAGSSTPSSSSSSRPAPSGGRASSWSREPLCRPAQPGRRSSSSGRAVASSSSGPSTWTTRVSSRSQRSSSAQCTSSIKHDGRPLGDESVEEVDPRVVEALARDERVQVFGRSQADREAEERVGAEPLGDDLRRIAVEDPEVLLEHLGERPVRDALAVGEAAARAAQRRRVLRREPLPQLTDEARLPDAGVAEDRHQLRAPAGRDSAVRLLELGKLGLPADERPAQPADSARAHQRQRTHEPAALEPSGLPFRLDRHRLPELEGAARREHGALAGEDLAGRGGLLEPRTDVHGVAADERAAFARTADDHLSRVHPDPQRQPVAEQLAEPTLHRKRCMQRALGVVLLRRRRPERGHDRVSHELLDSPTDALDLCRHRFVEAVEQRACPLGILRIRELRRPDQVGEEHGHELALLGGRQQQRRTGAPQAGQKRASAARLAPHRSQAISHSRSVRPGSGAD